MEIGIGCEFFTRNIVCSSAMIPGINIDQPLTYCQHKTDKKSSEKTSNLLRLTKCQELVMELWQMHVLLLQTLEMGCTRHQVVHERMGEMVSWVRTEGSYQWESKIQ